MRGERPFVKWLRAVFAIYLCVFVSFMFCHLLLLYHFPTKLALSQVPEAISFMCEHLRDRDFLVTENEENYQLEQV
jgi:hypothetical protein